MARDHRCADLNWSRELAERRNQPKPSYEGMHLHDLYTQLRARKAASERRARLIAVGLIPSVLALIAHLNW
jgi:hypothetical protein